MKNYKKILGISFLTAVIGLMVFGAISRTTAQSETAENDLLGNVTTEADYGKGNSNGWTDRTAVVGTEMVVENNTSATPLAYIPVGEVDQTEIDGLLFMREEEKLARDVYTFLAAQWNLPIFSNIASSEQTHMDSILTLIDRYSLTDSASPLPGVFNNTDLQTLYTQLIAQGSGSIEEAFKVGGAIEEIDILDLQKRLPQTDQVDIQLVYQNLLSASYNHLNAFASNLQGRTGSVYVPQYLSADIYQTIVSSGTTTGGVNGTGAGNRGNGRGNH
ncbi:MAG: DUF2202 domain-containing protein [Chloroflexi bacterium]|nr:DUF2202 domain-containing protein [Chloroflexota bacterium]